MLELRPIDFKKACDFVDKHHRHNLKPVGWKFGISVWEDDILVGVVTVGRPVSRRIDDGFTLEVTRCCTDGTKNACSKLYSSDWRAAKALGYRKLITYTRKDEPGASVKASGFRRTFEGKAGSWNSPSRPREDNIEIIGRVRWEREGKQ